ncbi:MAG: two-component system response regulator [Piscirickettsiaceae bacterium]|nr:MAG: two-component system response regulator [Piscirickettsiaceae bacterium]PCI70959.1 MAG: two-component system response regulator [Piscirickettsiaceae bacterium]
MVGEFEKQKLLIIDDDELYCDVLRGAFESRGYEVAVAHDIEQSQQRIKQFQPELAVVDLRLEQESGLHIIKALKAHDENTQIVMLTGYASIATAVEAVKLGARQYITKPANADEILAAFSKQDGDVDLAPAERPLSVKRMQWEHMQKVLLECDGNISETARQLNMHRRTLQRMLAKRPVKE